MSNLTCPGCGSVYPLAAVQKFDQFKCAICHGTIVVPIAGPAPSRAAPRDPVRAVPHAPPPVHASPAATSVRAAPHARAERRPAREAPPPSKINWPLVGAGAAVLGATIVATFLLTDKPAEPTTGVAGPQPAAPVRPVEPAAPKADPTKDAAAWKALPAAARADATTKYLASIDARSTSALAQAYAFLKARDEPDAMKRVAEMALALDPGSGWAHQARGDQVLTDRIEGCLGECTRADQAETAGVQRIAKLRKERKPASGEWWADAPLQKEIETTLAQIRAEEKALQDPYQWGLARWRMYQRRIEVMKDHPAIDDVVGPYLLFVQIKAPLGTPVESVPEIEMNRAKRVMNQNKTLFGAFHEGFHAQFGARFGLAKYDKSTLDEKTILKANIFADTTTWELYHQRIGFLPFAMGIRAYYDGDEPRFISSYDPGGDELSSQTDQCQCHEATHQLLHFYTWDLTRKVDGRELSWSECHTRPMWMEEGFAEFFSSHRRENGKYVWMQPLDQRMEELWAWSAALAKKRWAAWSLDEMLAIVDDEQMVEQARRRVLPKPVKHVTEEQIADLRKATRVLPSLFYGKAWSLVTYLWTKSDVAGRPVYRDAFQRFLEESLHVKQAAVPGRGLQTHVLTAGDFRKAMGLESENAFRGFEKDWLAWEAATLEKAKKPGWGTTRDGAIEMLTK